MTSMSNRQGRTASIAVVRPSIVRRAVTRIVAALSVFAALGTPLAAQGDARFAARRARVSDAIVARDLARFDSLARTISNTRLAIYADLAREAYERNDDGALTSRLLDIAEGKRSPRDIRANRGDLWAVLDSVLARTDLTGSEKNSIEVLELFLVRAGVPLLGAPACKSYEKAAEQLAAQLRRPPAPVAPAPEPAPVVPAPRAAPAVPLVPAELRAVPSLVHFALDKSLLAPPTRKVLDAVVDSLAHYRGVTVVLEGHTDIRGSAAYNEALSNRRVSAVRDYLVAKGLGASRISTKAMGKSKLDTDQTGVRDHALNRRVVLRYFAADGKEIPTLAQLDDLQLEKKK